MNLFKKQTFPKEFIQKNKKVQKFPILDNFQTF